MVRNGLCFTYLLLPFAILFAGVMHFKKPQSFPDTGFWPRHAPVTSTVVTSPNVESPTAMTKPSRLPAAAAGSADPAACAVPKMGEASKPSKDCAKAEAPKSE